MKQSEQGTLNKEDWKQTAIKALMIIGATAIPAIIEQLRLIDFGRYQSTVTIVIFLLAYLGQRLRTGTNR